MVDPSQPYGMADLGDDAKRVAPAAGRNVGPIGDVLADWLPQTGKVLEIASGTGEHALAFARRFPGLDWQPSDHDPLALASISAWRTAEGPENLLESLDIDASSADWPVTRADAILSINMVHIAPWACAKGLAAAAGRLLPNGGRLILYGPWWMEGVERTQSNLDFDKLLKSRNKDYGLRDVADFAALATSHRLHLLQTRPMPSNNLMLLFEKA